MRLKPLPGLMAAARFVRSLPQVAYCLKATFVFLLIFIGVDARSQWSGTSPIYYNGGNVGIGTDNPGTKLHVSGGHLAATENDLSAFVQLWTGNAIIWKHGLPSYNALRFGSANNLVADGWSEKMRITDKGMLGIGTTAPNAYLHVVAPDQNPGSYAAIFDKPRVATNGAFVYTFENVGGTFLNGMEPFWRGFHLASPYITVNSVNTFPRLAFYAEYDSYTDPTMRKWMIRAANATVPHDIQFMSDNTSLLYLKSNGNVGIGTDVPGSFKLAVEGKLGARKVIVTQNVWADYVFDSTYVLRPLSQVEQFIKTNKHLPEVPSAVEVKSDGLDLGDNQATLLKKIEELTLYIIEEHKKNEAQQKEIEELKKQLKRH